jgi:hypothetical protein
MKQLFEWIKATPDNLPKEFGWYLVHNTKTGRKAELFYIEGSWLNENHNGAEPLDSTHFEYLSPASPLPISGDGLTEDILKRFAEHCAQFYSLDEQGLWWSYEHYGTFRTTDELYKEYFQSPVKEII